LDRKDFVWKVARFDSRHMEIQLEFNNQAALSSDYQDRLQFHYKKPEKFLVYALNGALPPEGGFKQRVNVQKQLELTVIETV